MVGKRSQSVRCRMHIRMEMPNGQFVHSPTQAWERRTSEQRSSVGLSHVEGMKPPWPGPEHVTHKHLSPWRALLRCAMAPAELFTPPRCSVSFWFCKRNVSVDLLIYIVSLTYSKLRMFKVYSLLRFNLRLHPRNHPAIKNCNSILSISHIC